jgi:cell division protease FtsH
MALGGVVELASIVKRGEIGGAVSRRSGSGAPVRSAIDDEVTKLLCGRSAEILICGSSSTGAENDLARATWLMSNVHGAWGLGETLLHLGETEAASRVVWDPVLRPRVEADLQAMAGRAEALLLQHCERLKAIADALVARRWLDRQAIEEIWKKVGSSAQVARSGS